MCRLSHLPCHKALVIVITLQVQVPLYAARSSANCWGAIPKSASNGPEKTGYHTERVLTAIPCRCRKRTLAGMKRADDIILGSTSRRSACKKGYYPLLLSFANVEPIAHATARLVKSFRCYATSKLALGTRGIGQSPGLEVVKPVKREATAAERGTVNYQE